MPVYNNDVNVGYLVTEESSQSNRLRFITSCHDLTVLITGYNHHACMTTKIWGSVQRGYNHLIEAFVISTIISESITISCLLAHVEMHGNRHTNVSYLLWLQRSKFLQ